MGLFGGNWSAPGPGVEKDAPKKKGIFLYFEIFLRKFWNLLHVNVIYFTASILFIVMLYVVAPIPKTVVDSMTDSMMVTVEQEPQKDTKKSNNAEQTEITPEEQRASIAANLQVGLRSMFAVMVFALWGCAPMAAGYAYVTRCFTREQHAWVWSDFKDKVMENFKQSIVVLVVDIAVMVLAFYAIFFYYMSYLTTSQYMWLILCSVIAMLLFVYTMMHYYIYQLMVTFKCTIKQLYKNALLLAFAKLPMNILFTVLSLGLNYILFIVLSPAVALGLSFFIWVSITRFPIEFYAARVLQKLFIDGAENKIDAREDER